MMIFLYGLIIVFMVAFMFYTRDYKKAVVTKLNSKEHPLKFSYGSIMYVQDKVLCKLKIPGSEKMNHVLKELYVKEKVEDIRYTLRTKRISLCILVFIFFIVMGLGKSIQEGVAAGRTIKNLDRPQYGQGDKNYKFNAALEGEGETVSVDLEIGELQLTDEEKLAKIEECYKKLIILFLGENEAQDEITGSLDLIDELEGITISWQIENTELIDYTGKVYLEKVEGEGVLTYITAVLSLQESEKAFEIPIVIKAGDDDGQMSLEEKIQNDIAENNSVYEGQIELPSKIDDKSIVFIENISNQSEIFFVIAILGGIIVFFMQNREMQNKIKKRNEQMKIDYAEIVSKLTLLNEAGLSLSKAWNKIVQDYEKNKNNKMRFAYEEMRLANIKMKNGTPEGGAYAEFGKRCNLQCYLRLGGLLEQNIMKGTKGLKTLLEQEVREAFEERKNNAKIKGEEASTKLLFPMMLVLIVVIVIIVVPAFLSMHL